METRQITQVHIYFLLLNSMYDRCEARDIVLVADSKEKIYNYYNNNLLPDEEMFRDDNGYYHSFKSDSLLCNHNPLPFSLGLGEDCYDNLGIMDDWVEESSLYNIRSRYNWIEY